MIFFSFNKLEKWKDYALIRLNRKSKYLQNKGVYNLQNTMAREEIEGERKKEKRKRGRVIFCC